MRLLLRKASFLLLILALSIISRAQFHYDEYSDIRSFSFLYPKIERFKLKDKINTLHLPCFNNDSLFWIKNIEQLLPRADTGPVFLVFTRAYGIAIDTTIAFFPSASRIRINEGFLWLYKITSPTAHSLRVMVDSFDLRPDQYLCIYTNFIDSVNGPYDYHCPLVYAGVPTELKGTSEDIFRRGKFGEGEVGNTIYIEVFSPDRSIEKSNMRISRLVYGWPTNAKLSDAPDWIREKYPKVDFNYYEKRNK
jgi:hypothetical protein